MFVLHKASRGLEGFYEQHDNGFSAVGPGRSPLDGLRTSVFRRSIVYPDELGTGLPKVILHRSAQFS